MLENDHASQLARGMRLPGIGGSDAHSVREVGVCATEFGGRRAMKEHFSKHCAPASYRARRV